MTALAAVVLAVSVGQPVGGYAGTWTAVYQGTTYVRLNLQAAAGGPQGAMSIGESVHVDAQGRVDSASEASSSLTSITDAHWDGAALSFSLRDGDDVQRFEFRVIDANSGELTPVLTDEQRQELSSDGVPLPKPFRLARVRR